MSKSLLNAALCGALFAAGLTVQAAPREVTYLLPAPPNSPAFAPWVIAREKGYHADLGLKVTFVAGKGGVDVAKQIGAGNAPVGGAIGDTPIVVRANGIPVKAVAVLGAGGVTMIATDGTAGIDSVKDLKGKTLTVMSYPTPPTTPCWRRCARLAWASPTWTSRRPAHPASGNCSPPAARRPWPACRTGW